MNTVCKTFKHPHEPTQMERRPNEIVDGKEYAVWECPRPECRNVRRQGLRTKTKEPHDAHSTGDNGVRDQTLPVRTNHSTAGVLPAA